MPLPTDAARGCCNCPKQAIKKEKINLYRAG